MHQGLQEDTFPERPMHIIEHDGLCREKRFALLTRLLHGFLCLPHQLRQERKIRAEIALPGDKPAGRQDTLQNALCLWCYIQIADEQHGTFILQAKCGREPGPQDMIQAVEQDGIFAARLLDPENGIGLVGLPVKLPEHGFCPKGYRLSSTAGEEKGQNAGLCARLPEGEIDPHRLG